MNLLLPSLLLASSSVAAQGDGDAFNASSAPFAGGEGEAFWGSDGDAAPEGAFWAPDAEGSAPSDAAPGEAFWDSDGETPESPAAEPSAAVLDAIEVCGEIVDSHLHESLAFPDVDSLMAEMSISLASRGILMAVYGAKPSPFSEDPNTSVQQFAEESGGRIYGLVSLNATGGNWTEARDEELARLASFLEREAVVGAKIAPPHSCVQLQSETMRDIVDVVSQSSHRVMYIHVGTTPFCGPFGLFTQGMIGCCGRDYVDPQLLEGLIEEYANVTFVLLHAGHDFLEEDSEHYYDNELVDHSVAVARQHDNVYLEISAFLKQPRANETMQKIVNGNLTERVVYGSDVNHFPGEMLPYLELAIPAMTDAGFSDEAVCRTLRGNAIEVFGLPAEPPGMGGGNNETEEPMVGLPTESPTSPPTGTDENGGGEDSTSSGGGGDSMRGREWIVFVGSVGVFFALWL
ncbi:hypothetical protein ACHAXT_013351 [Thalassiosira profunda]